MCIPLRKRVEEEKGKYHFVISRAVTDFPSFAGITLKNIDREQFNSLRNGIIYLKGGDLSDESLRFGDRLRIWDISDFFSESFFETKKILHLIP